MKIYILHITLFFCGLLLINGPISAQVLLPQYSMWEGFAFSNQQAVESREAEERFARFLLGLEHQTPTQQAELIGALLAKAEQNNATARFLLLAEMYEDVLFEKGVQVVAVYIDDEVEAWQKAQYPSAWLSVYAPEIDKQDLYDIKALPTLYLLNTQKLVLLKDVQVNRVISPQSYPLTI